MRSLPTLLFVTLLGVACTKADHSGDTKSGSGSSTTAKTGSGSGSNKAGSGSAAVVVPVAPAKDIDSKDILARTDVNHEVDVKHVLVSWKDLSATYGGRQDARGASRTNEDAAKLAQEVLDKLKADPKQIDALIKQYGEDPGMQSGNPYTIKDDTPFVPEFKNLAMRLKESEAGIVKTSFGYHVIERVPPPPPDPLESADILKRDAPKEMPEPNLVLHILIGWKDIGGRPDPRAMKRTKEEADKIATDLLARVRKGEDMKKLMKEFSEDPGSKDSGKTYEVSPDARLVEPFKRLGMRLKLDEAGLVKTQFGWHVMKRVAPPPPDPLNSKDILARKPETEKAKVKHILLGWKEVHAEDERGKNRSRADLEKLVKATVARLAKDKIEDVMKELSEDPGSAATGESYDVTPKATLVDPFKQLSLRLKVGEVGVVKTDFGIHIIKRVE